MINIDSDAEGIIFIGCAGGIDLKGNAQYEMDAVPQDWDTIDFTVSGLKGGHSGGEIHNQRLNAICALVRMLVSIRETGVPFRLAFFEGGTKLNVIPSSATCAICVPEDKKHDVVSKVVETFNTIKEENKYEEPDFTMSRCCSKHGAVRRDKALDETSTMLVLNALYTSPHGVFTMSKAIEGIVETSDNLAIAGMKDGAFSILFHIRSSVDSAKRYLADRIRAGLESFGVTCLIDGSYPAWTPDPDSKLAGFCARAYEDMFGKKPVVTAIHAGLECGVINSRCPGMDSVSIGPEMHDIHSTDERLSISSTKRTYEFVKYLVSIIK